MNLSGMGSFEGWTSVVRAALVWVGEPDPGLTREDNIADSSRGDIQSLQQLIEGLEEFDPMRSGVPANEIRKRIDDETNKFGVLRDALEELCPSRNGKPASAKSLGRKLRTLRDKPVRGLMLTGFLDRDGITIWKVKSAPVTTTAAGFTGFAGGGCTRPPPDSPSL